MYPQHYSKTIKIYSTSGKIWEALTQKELMKKWMAEEGIEIITDWRVGTPFIIKGTDHWVYFENTGIVLAYQPEKLLSYSHISSLSKLPGTSENYTNIEFRLENYEKHIALTLSMHNFATESIYKHVVFYWNTTLEILKAFIEDQYYNTL